MATLLTKTELSDEETATINRLSMRHDAELGELEAYDRYYEGTQPLSYMHPDILREVADRIRPVIIFWPQVVVDSVEERLRLEGFKTGDEELDKELWRVWLANEMQVGFRQATVDSLVMRRSYISVGTNEEDKDTPLVTPESPLEVYVEPDPRTRRGRAGLRRIGEYDPVGGGLGNRYLTLYLPNETTWCSWSGGWKVDNRDQHNLGRLPIAPMVNRGRLRSSVRTPSNNSVERIGRSDLDPVIPLSDAGSKMATDMMVAGEFVAVPLRGLFGVGPDDFKDEHGNPVSPMQAILGRLLALKPKSGEVKAFEWAAGQLQNFTGALDALAKLTASMSGLPPHYLGMSSDNPASAEAIAGSESRLATRAERKQDPFGCTAGYVARLVRRFQTGSWDKALDAVTPDWRNVRTPTVGAVMDAVVKGYQADIIPLKQARERLGYTETEIEAMELEDAAAAQRSPVGQLARGLADQRPADAGGNNNY